jgi:hypothetical protein
MHRIAWFILLAAWLAFPVRAADTEVPEPLKPWVDWVLEDHRDYRCPFLYNSFEAKRCSWPSRLTLDLQAQQGRFEMDLTVYAESWVQLPGDAKYWPQQVTVGGKPASVLERNGFPALQLAAGNYRIEGEFFWDTLPESLAVPQDSGLIDLTVQGQSIPLPNLKDAQLWIKQTDLGLKTPQNAQNKTDLQVFRRIIDDVPLQVVTRIDIDVSGLQREIKLPSPLLPGFIPMQLQSPLPARLEADGQLLLQVRPGHWQVEVLARHPQELRQLALSESAAPWPEAEVWVFDARPYQRVVEIKNLAAVDPQQTNLPEDWRALPAYRINRGEAMQFTVIRRGDSDPEPNRLSLQRRLWLDFDGGGYTVNDRINGTMTKDWRLNALPELKLGQVSLDGNNQLVTRLPGSDEQGVEVRRGAIDLNADSRIESRASLLGAVGWRQPFHHVSAELNLPPGWRLLGASGVDNVPDSWISRWTLLDLFVVLIAALAVGRLWNFQWGLFALLTLSLIWHEPGAPRYVWLHILAAAALLKVLPEGRFFSWIKWYRNVFWLALALLAIPFMAGQIRIALYPQLEYPYQAIQPVPYDTSARPAAVMPVSPAQAPAETEMPKSEEEGRLEGKEAIILHGFARRSAGGYAYNAAPAVNFERIDPNANVQTGPGLPQWQWKKIPLSWNGPVDSTQQIRFWLLPPLLAKLFNVLRVAFIAALSLLMFSVLDSRIRLKWPPSFFAVALLPLMLLPPEPARADFPDQAMLDALQRRLLKAPECAPQCAQISHMQVSIDSDKLQIGLQTHNRENVAVPLPAQAEQWFPNRATVDGAAAQGLFRDEQGGLWLYLSEGRHSVVLEGRVALQHKFSLPLPLQPHRVSVSAQDWQVDGIHEHGVPDAQLQFTRIAGESAAAQPQTALQPGILPPFVSVERTLQLGLDWRVQTRIVRLSPPDSAVVLEVPLLPGESVTSTGTHVRDGKVLVNMPPQQSELAWEATLEKAAQIDFAAAPTDRWVEVWRADVSPIWHLQSEGPSVVHQRNPQGVWLPEWRPWPGEKLRLAITRPDAVPGQTVTIDKSALRLSPGDRMLEASLELTLRSSKGGQQVLTLPENADLQTVTIDGSSQPLRLTDRQLIVPLKPGAQTVQLSWRQNGGIAPWLRSPEVNLGSASVNSHVQINLGQDRWTLFTLGPSFGPAVLFWGVLAVIALLAFGLGRIRSTPLRTWQWFLLSIGLSQIPLAAAVIVAGWLLALGLRAERLRPETSRWFNAAQVALGLWSLLALVLLFVAVQQGLLGVPDMQIGGNQSTAYQLNWYQDRNAALLPSATVVSVPLICYRLLMLAWSLWLALALLAWLKWGWGCFASGGLWKKGPPKKPPNDTQDSVAPLRESPTPNRAEDGAPTM